MFPLAGLVVRLGPAQLEHVGEEHLGEAVAPHDAFAEAATLVGQADPVVGGDQALGFEALHHLADRRPRHLEPFGDARLDDLDVVLVQLEDALAVLLEGGMVFTARRHPVILPAPPIARPSVTPSHCAGPDVIVPAASHARRHPACAERAVSVQRWRRRSQLSA